MLKLTPSQEKECEGCVSLFDHTCTAFMNVSLPKWQPNCPCRTCILKVVCQENCDKFNEF